MNEGTEPDLTSDLARAMYRTMARIRTFEVRAERLFLDGKLPGFVHLYIGEEAIATGVCQHLRRDDYITSTHRGHGHTIAKGASLDRMMAEIYGKATGMCHGKGGSMHIADFSVGMLGANGVVGGGFAIATGAGLSVRLRRTNQVAVCFFGDGASNRGTFHESLNMAAAWRLPVVYVCENNGFASTTPFDRDCDKCDENGKAAPWPVQSVQQVAVRGAAYGIPTWSVDGNDVVAVYRAATEAIVRARHGEGPSLLECFTYRIKGHFVGDPERYRTRTEVEEFWRREPLGRFRRDATAAGLLTDADCDEIDRAASIEVDAAVAFAESSPWPNPADATADLYV